MFFAFGNFLRGAHHVLRAKVVEEVTQDCMVAFGKVCGRK
jgi:hypothetical protein